LVDDVVPSEHLIQCLSYFLIFEYVDVLAFISYDPRNPEKSIFEKWIERDDYPLNKIEDAILEFENLIDELKEKITGDYDKNK
jgi:thiaminase